MTPNECYNGLPMLMQSISFACRRGHISLQHFSPPLTVYVAATPPNQSHPLPPLLQNPSYAPDWKINW